MCGSCKSVFFQRIKEGGEHATVFEYGGFWIRLAAKFLDGIIGNVVVYGLLFVMGAVFSGMANEASPVFAVIMLFVTYGIPLAYTTFFIGKYGATPGKMAAGLKVVRPDGEPVSYARAFGRHFAEMLSGLILAIG